MASWRQLAEDDGQINDGKKYRVVTRADKLMAAMFKDDATNPVEALVKKGKAKQSKGGALLEGVRMPIYEPLMCASFAAKNLGGKDGGEHDQAGRDPWSICDYLRDSLKWPASLIFIVRSCGIQTRASRTIQTRVAPP